MPTILNEPHARGVARHRGMARAGAARYHGTRTVPDAHEAAAVLEKIVPAVIVVACLIALARLVLGERRRYALDRAIARWSRSVRSRVEGLFTWNADRRRARRAADEAIRRAKDGGEWDGNVYRPKSFQGRKDRKIH